MCKGLERLGDLIPIMQQYLPQVCAPYAQNYVETFLFVSCSESSWHVCQQDSNFQKSFAASKLKGLQNAVSTHTRMSMWPTASVLANCAKLIAAACMVPLTRGVAVSYQTALGSGWWRRLHGDIHKGSIFLADTRTCTAALPHRAALLVIYSSPAAKVVVS